MIKIVMVLSILLNILIADKNIEINLTQQKLIAWEKGKEVIHSKICSGRPGYETPNGKYKVLEKEKMHISNRYPIKDKAANIRGGAKMPYMLRVTNTGIAIHAGEMVPYPDSHGCIRIPYGKAMELYKWSDVGTKITIIGKAPFSDKINQMRLGILDINNEFRDKKLRYNKVSKSVKWVEDYLDYYNDI